MFLGVNDLNGLKLQSQNKAIIFLTKTKQFLYNQMSGCHNFTVFMVYFVYYILFRILLKYLILVITVSHYRAYFGFDLLQSMETLYEESNEMKIQSFLKFLKTFILITFFCKNFWINICKIYARFLGYKWLQSYSHIETNINTI